MILSNLILFHLLFKNYNNNNYLMKVFNDNQIDYKKTVSLVGCNLNKFLFNVVLKPSKMTDVNDLFDIKTKQHFVSRNFWQKLVNKYWQETIFISNSNSSSENYMNKLKAAGLSVYKSSDYKTFLMNFSQDLLNGNIQVSIDKKTSSFVPLIFDQNNMYVKYRWFKFLKFKQISFGFKNKFRSSYILEESKTLPLFTLINKNSQIVMSESPEMLLRNKNFVNLTTKFLSIFFITPKESKKLYTGLLFINPEDAVEYKNHIQSQYSKSTRVNSIKFVSSNLDLYHELLSSSVNNAEFRLVPDLKELSNFIYRYRKYKHILIDQNQKYGFNYFQGQPIYIIKSFKAKNRNTNLHESVDYFYHVNKKESFIEYQPIFLNYQTAINAWNKFKKTHDYYNLPSKPQIYVSNLESFIQTSDYKNNHSRMVFIPSFQTYKFIRQFSQKTSTTNFYFIKSIVQQTSYLKTLLFRFIWSLTSRQPINW
uniref:Ycf80 n=1 Tax=Bostrychia moritziana TaxID=103713 RepID=A0A1Z1M6A9_BOSMO|nr:hypothetical protein [Bostrychia moritziana]ARW61627.1 hypothetical protein [Bostrychia moritziana]